MLILECEDVALAPCLRRVVPSGLELGAAPEDVFFAGEFGARAAEYEPDFLPALAVPVCPYFRCARDGEYMRRSQDDVHHSSVGQHSLTMVGEKYVGKYCTCVVYSDKFF